MVVLAVRPGHGVGSLDGDGSTDGGPSGSQECEDCKSDRGSHLAQICRGYQVVERLGVLTSVSCRGLTSVSA